MYVDETVVQLVRSSLAAQGYAAQEAVRMGGLSFMIDGKVCARVQAGTEIIVRCVPADTDLLLQTPGVGRMQMKGKPEMKGWLSLELQSLPAGRPLEWWLAQSVAFVRQAK